MYCPFFDFKAVEALNENDRIDLPEKIPSCINGLITGLLGLYVIFWDCAFKFDVINPYPPILDTLFSNYVGYTIYDLCIMSTKTKEDSTMWIHHIVGLVGASLMPFFQKGAFFPVLFTITEVTVIPGNLVWLLQRLNKKDTSLYEVALALRAAAFIVFRPFAAPFCLYYAFNNPGPLAPYAATILRAYVDADGKLPDNTIALINWNEKLQILQSNLVEIPKIVPILSIIFIALLGFLNLVWSLVVAYNYAIRVVSLFRKERIFDENPISSDKKVD
ncbi:hypothetical protein DSO57_1019751 [Entomophthora muscae]|uniref:Uncharacterized protein n=1 Tax=Entomophthora muscae TaxID=34485 RepID=A0ACC2SSQ3_9FUNG|nr:hypothetical protein DSO57_1019751 [Entomophthora muscae]